MNNYTLFTFTTKGVTYTSQFVESHTLPEGAYITTPFNFPFLSNRVMLILDKNNWWNPLGGHRENNETWQETLHREVQEEGGVKIAHVVVVGYIKISHADPSSPYPMDSILPITYSSIVSIDSEWKPLETKERRLLSKDDASALLALRTDNNQILEIFNYILSVRKARSLSYEFLYHTNTILLQIPISQIYGFVSRDNGDICIVRDAGEKHFSLPGGGCEIGETPEDALRREVQEEAQCDCEFISLLGSVEVKGFLGEECIEHFQQVRYFAKLKNIQNFIPHKNGFEIEERLFVPLSDVSRYVSWLTTDIGKIIFDQLCQTKR
ncbi:MAG: NUDIX domain-containing protein [Candidatus Taylorbacteria bacterium]|nr:NUDIX domain-containing protein [Candidatus Taylorbacteria bacterium]